MDKVSVAEAKKHFSDLMARVAYSGQRIVIERHGKPMMAWISLDDLEQLETSAQKNEERREARRMALAQAAAVRRLIQEERGDEPLSDSTELIQASREGRVDEFSRLR